MEVIFFGEKARHPSPPVDLFDGSSSTAAPTSKIREVKFLEIWNFQNGLDLMGCLFYCPLLVAFILLLLNEDVGAK